MLKSVKPSPTSKAGFNFYKIEPWKRPHLGLLGDLRIALLGLALFAVLAIYYLMVITGFIPFSFDLNPQQQPDGSWQVNQSQRLLSAVATQLGVKDRDLIVEADGRIPQSAEQINHATQLRLRHLDENTFFTLNRQTFYENANEGIVNQISFGVIALVCFSISFLVYLLARQRLAASLFFLTCTTLAVALLSSAIFFNGQAGFSLLQAAGAMLTTSSLFHLLVIFPRDNTASDRQGWLRYLRPCIWLSYGLTGFTIVCLVIYVFWPPIYVLPRLAINLQLSLVGFGGLIVTIVKAFQLKSDQAKSEMRAIAFSIAFALGPYLVLDWIPAWLIHIRFLSSSLLLGLFIILPLGFAYSIVQFQSFGIRNLMRRNVVYGLLALLLFVPYSLLLYLARLLIGLDNFATYIWAVALFSVPVTISFNWLRTYMQKLLDRLIFKDAYDYQTALYDITSRLAQHLKLAEVGHTVLSSLIQLFNLEFAALSLYVETTRNQPQLYYSKLLRHNQSTVFSSQPYLLEALEIRLPQPDNVYLLWLQPDEHPLAAIEIAVNNQMRAVLTLSTRLNEETFNSADITLVKTLTGALIVSLRNALLVDDLEHKVGELQSFSDQLRRSKNELQQLNREVVRATEAERIRLTHEIHDDPLQRLMLVLRQFDERDETITPREHFCWTVNKEVSTTLRNICMRLRPPILDDMGLSPAVRALVGQVRQDSGLTISAFVNLDSEQRRLDAEVEIVLYRVAQEALQNVVKHSQATRVSLELTENEEFLTLRVSDNGCGFVVDPDGRHLLEAGHLGLVGLRERLHNIGGVLKIQSWLGQGTVLEAQISLTTKDMDGKQDEQSTYFIGR